MEKTHVVSRKNTKTGLRVVNTSLDQVVQREAGRCDSGSQLRIQILSKDLCDGCAGRGGEAGEARKIHRGLVYNS